MSKDLLHHLEWQQEHEDLSVLNNRTYGVLRYVCGNGWQFVTGLTLHEANTVKEKYNKTDTQLKIIQVIE